MQTVGGLLNKIRVSHSGSTCGEFCRFQGGRVYRVRWVKVCWGFNGGYSFRGHGLRISHKAGQGKGDNGRQLWFQSSSVAKGRHRSTVGRELLERKRGSCHAQAEPVVEDRNEMADRFVEERNTAFRLKGERRGANDDARAAFCDRHLDDHRGARTRRQSVCS